MRPLRALPLTNLARAIPWRGFRLLRGCLPLVLVVMEFCWIYPWVLLLTGLFYGRAATPLLPAWLTLGLLLLGHQSQHMSRTTASLTRGRVAVVGSGLLIGLLAVKHTYYAGWALWQLGWLWELARAAHDALPAVAPPVIGALTAAVLWWRGVILGEREVTHAESEQAFHRGTGWSVAFVLLMAIYGDSPAFALTGPAVSYLLGFLALGLIGLAVARLVGIWEESHADDDQALAMNRHWLVLLVMLVGAMVLLAGALASVVNVDIWSHLGTVLEPLLPVVDAIFFVIFAIAGVFARAILYVLTHIRPIQGQVRPPGAGPFEDFLRRLQNLAVPEPVTSSARWGMVLAVVAILSLLIALAVVRARRSSRRPGDDERESVWSTRAALGDLAAALRSLWPSRRRLADQDDDSGVAAVRRLYRELLRLAAAGGFPRDSAQTPYEYLPQLGLWVPERNAECGIITEAYVRVRYTPHNPTPEEVTAVEAAVDGIRRQVSLQQS